MFAVNRVIDPKWERVVEQAVAIDCDQLRDSLGAEDLAGGQLVAGNVDIGVSDRTFID